MIFEYDAQKSQVNRDKHGISFEDAKQLWFVPAVEIRAQPRFDEERFMLIGKLGDKFTSCIFTMRGEAFRIISARRSRKKEVELYYAIIQEKKS